MRSLKAVLILRGTMAAIVGTIAIVSFVNGNVVIGALLSALAITNVALIVTITRRRRHVRGRFQSVAARRNPLD